jgi:hypothetical protein
MVNRRITPILIQLYLQKPLKTFGIYEAYGNERGKDFEECENLLDI